MSASDPPRTHPRDAELIGWLTGALEPGEERRLADELRGSRALRARLDLLRAMSTEGDLELERRIFVAPAWVRGPAPPLRGRLSLLRAGSSEAHGYAGGDSSLLVQLRITPPDDTPRMVIILTRDLGGWQVIFPASPEMETRLDELELDGPERVLEHHPPSGGRLRYLVALPRPGEAAANWEAPEDARWDALRRALARGEVLTLSLELEVP